MNNLPILKNALLFLHVEELRAIASKFSLPDNGKKIAIINRIIHFLETGIVLQEPKLPKSSIAQRGKIYPLAPEIFILKGSYKNDLTTRLFFKNLIGNHFHFTAFGIDWINEKWISGTPPTYLEFAEMWQSEYNLRKKEGSTPKEEWAYINFTRNFIKQNPDSSKEIILKAWDLERKKHKEIVDRMLMDVYTK